MNTINICTTTTTVLVQWLNINLGKHILSQPTLANAPEFEDAIRVVPSSYKNYSVPDAEVVDAGDDEHAPWGILLEMLVLDGQTVVFQRLKFRRLYFTEIGTFREIKNRSQYER